MRGQKKTKRQVKENTIPVDRNNYFLLTENAPFGIAAIAGDGTYIYINSKFKKTFGYDLSDIPDGKTWFKKAYPDKRVQTESDFYMEQ
jgi:two-component system, sporulation sensor kinase E